MELQWVPLSRGRGYDTKQGLCATSLKDPRFIFSCWRSGRDALRIGRRLLLLLLLRQPRSYNYAGCWDLFEIPPHVFAAPFGACTLRPRLPQSRHRCAAPRNTGVDLAATFPREGCRALLEIPVGSVPRSACVFSGISLVRMSSLLSQTTFWKHTQTGTRRSETASEGDEFFSRVSRAESAVGACRR